MNKKQYFGIKYPFTSNNDNGYYVDLNQNTVEKTRSLVTHVLFTPKGQRIRNPEFGTDLIKYIFEPNSGVAWSQVMNSVTDSITKFIPSVNITNIQVIKDENNEQNIFVRIDMQIKSGNQTVTDSFITKL